MTNIQKQYKLAIVDDHNLFRKGLIKLINLADRKGRFEVLFEAANGIDLKEKLNARELPDIILMDIDMPDMDGYSAVDWLRKTFPDIHVLVVSMFESEESIMRMLKMGVSGYLSKDIEVEDMNKALTSIADRGFYYSELVTAVMARNIQGSDSDDGEPAGIRGNKATWIHLTENEKEFLRLACTELTYQQIADQMHLSPKTIDGYREALFSKFSVRSRVSLAMYAVRNRFVKI